MTSPSYTAFPVLTKVTPYWSEVDALGHINNARYFTWFEEARMALLAEIGAPMSGTPSVGPILAQTSCVFHAPVYWPSTLEIGARVTRIGRSSVTMEYVAFLFPTPPDPHAEPKCVATGSGVVVMVDYNTGKSTEIPQEWRANLERLSR